MKIVQINTTCGIGSTGKICVDIGRMLSEQDHESYILYSYRTNECELGIGCSSKKYLRFQALKSKLFGNYGFNSVLATKRMINALDRIRPDIVNLHNIHGHDCNLEILFTYFKKNGIKVLWTFHDCWAFTGYCTHFTVAKCDKWKTACENCPQAKAYSIFFDKSSKLFKRKKQLLSDIDLTIITPSQWLADLVRQSFLKDYPIEVVNNGIDLGIFKPTESNFRQKYGLENKKIILGVSFGWNEKKGLDVFIDLSKKLPGEYRIVLIGTDDETEKQLPESIISIHRIQNQRELAQIYTAADLFVSASKEENYPTVHMEAIACGTPCLTFRTGGGPEIVDETCGSVVDCDDVDSLEKEIIRICTDEPYSLEQCTQKALNFDKEKNYKEYIELYERVISTGNERD